MTREEEIKQFKKEALNIYDRDSGGLSRYQSILYVDGITDGIKFADDHPKNPWISIEERLPAKYELVLVKTDIGKFYLAEKDSVAQPRDEFAIPQLSSYVNGVTHWMPIP